ncbi:MAG: High-affinity nickel transporter [Gemmatimonadaceae bacterium]|nr:High-affinity nickel transporter [Gemmatimonadaceae bacterium]
MNAILLVALSGLGAGSLHVVSGPDHLAAVGPLAVVAQRRAALIGASWGLGHASGAVLVGAVAIMLGERVPIRALAAVAEQFVGVLLICLGLAGLRRLRLAAPGVNPSLTHGPRTALHFGVFHGVAGSAHLFGVLPALLVPTLAGKCAFLTAFGVGAALAMTAIAQALGNTRTLVSQRRLSCGASVFSVIVGVVWLLRS